MDNISGLALETVVSSELVSREDDQLVQLWLHGRSRHTQRSYKADADLFRSFLEFKPLGAVTLGDIQAFIDTLAGLSDATLARRISSIKSLFSFGHKTGYLAFNVGAAVDVPKVRNYLAQRILTETQVIEVIALEKDPRNRAILRTLYLTGLRRSELVSLRWRDLVAREDGEGQLTVFGKGGKTRSVIIVASLWAELLLLRGEAPETDPVFRSTRTGGPLCPERITIIAKQAAVRAGLSDKVSAHWLRHCFASHSLNRGAKIHEVQADLGHSSPATTGKYLHARPSSSAGRYLPS